MEGGKLVHLIPQALDIFRVAPQQDLPCKLVHYLLGRISAVVSFTQADVATICMQ